MHGGEKWNADQFLPVTARALWQSAVCGIPVHKRSANQFKFICPLFSCTLAVASSTVWGCIHTLSCLQKCIFLARTNVLLYLSSWCLFPQHMQSFLHRCQICVFRNDVKFLTTVRPMWSTSPSRCMVAVRHVRCRMLAKTNVFQNK